jgi:uncharacterized protein YbjT (DUF2867 family)
VAGATGYTGREVVAELARRGVGAVAHVRPDSPKLEEWRRRFEPLGVTVDTTPWESAAFNATMARLKPDLVFGLLGTTYGRARKERQRGSNASYESVDYQLTSTLLNATRAQSPAARFIYLSSLGVREGARNSYIAVRWRLETELKASGLSYVIVHPALITGSDREEFRLGERSAAIAAMLFLGTARLIGLRSLADRFATMTGKQLGRALVNAALDPKHGHAVLEVPQMLELAKR